MGRKWGVSDSGHGDSLGDDENVLMASQFCDHTQNIELYTFKEELYSI